ncbi:MAG: anthrone oxygenase family protein [Gammaproteobacteria bacterium]
MAWNPHGKSRNRDIQPSGPLHGRRSIGRFCEASFDLLIASALYLVGTVLVTIVFNVPKNEALASVARAHPDGASLWAGYVASWTAWNHVRTAASLAAAASFSIALGY